MKTSKENLQVYIGAQEVNWCEKQEQLIKGKGECRLQHVKPSEVRQTFTQTNHVEGDQDLNSHELAVLACTLRAEL